MPTRTSSSTESTAVAGSDPIDDKAPAALLVDAYRRIAAESGGRAARSDARTLGHGRRPYAEIGRAVLRPRDAKSDRAGRHVSLARSAKGSLHFPRKGRLSRPRARAADRLAHDGNFRGRS